MHRSKKHHHSITSFGGNEQRARHTQAESGGYLLVDHKLEFDRLLDGQITRISAFQDAISV
jgi:hypothetical protein